MDGDFGRMLAATGERQPSLVYLRSQVCSRPSEQAPLLVAALDEHAFALRSGAVVLVNDDGTRVRPLPLGKH